jgi:hypothetical protein
VWNAVNPEGLGAWTFLWNDINRDRQFEDGEAGRPLKVSGSPFARLDPALRNPVTSEMTMGRQSGRFVALWLRSISISQDNATADVARQ